PLISTLVFSGLHIARSGGQSFLIDYLMPAELFPAALIGGILLLWACIRANSHKKMIFWGLAVLLIAFFLGLTVLPVVTGLATGETEAVGWPWMLTLGSLVIYILAMIELGITGISLTRSLFKH
ncbi:MAG: hypothetical protein HGA54_04235, partial [Actinobacteria bacterium]|nr:hypothetical protein [Actinomycetota bacterium]